MLFVFIIFAVSCNAKNSTNLKTSFSADNLDLLSDYDREIWSGPDGWTAEQWQWKMKLRWDKHCDYVADVEVYELEDKREVIQVMCVPGAYQPMYYLFLYDKSNNITTQLELGTQENTDNPKEIFGTMNFDIKNKHLSILTLSRGIGDCGVFRVYSFPHNSLKPKKIEHRARACSDAIHSESLPEYFFNPKLWPKVSITE